MDKLSTKKYTCKKCGHEGPSTGFRTPHKKGDDRHEYYDYCKKCHVEQARASRYKRLYNITTEEYDALLKFQKGACFICKRPSKSGQNRLAVDHCHRTGLIRGLLCWTCNQAIGKFRDNQYLLWSAFIYLFAPPAVFVLGGKRYGVVGRISKKAKNRKLGGKELEVGQYRLDPNALIQQLKLRASEVADVAQKGS
jgi:hypothetical protein